MERGSRLWKVGFPIWRLKCMAKRNPFGTLKPHLCRSPFLAGRPKAVSISRSETTLGFFLLSCSCDSIAWNGFPGLKGGSNITTPNLFHARDARWYDWNSECSGLFFSEAIRRNERKRNNRAEVDFSSFCQITDPECLREGSLLRVVICSLCRKVILLTISQFYLLGIEWLALDVFSQQEMNRTRNVNYVTFWDTNIGAVIHFFYWWK